MVRKMSYEMEKKLLGLTEEKRSLEWLITRTKERIDLLQKRSDEIDKELEELRRQENEMPSKDC